MNLNQLVIPIEATLREALLAIDENHLGIIMAIDKKNAVVGLATDGDIRRKLLNGASLSDTVALCINRNFYFGTPLMARENLLKKLDNRLRVIPILDGERRLIEVVSRANLPVRSEEAIYSRARAPVRISFGGGGSDTTHFFSDCDGAVISTTISVYSHASLRMREDEKIRVTSLDLMDSFEIESIDELGGISEKFGLIKSLLTTIKPNFGFELHLHSDFPMNSGLGGSAAVSATILGCFNEFRLDQWDSYELAELAFQAERLCLGINGGWQDQYATVFGGFNFMEFMHDKNVIQPLRIKSDILLELEESLVLCYTNSNHNSGEIHEDQRRQSAKEEIHEHLVNNVNLSYEIRNQLLRGDLLEFGKSLHEAWTLKRKFSKMVTNECLDKIYEDARASGAVGGKLLGAGGGGFFLFFVPPFRKCELVRHLQNANLNVCPFLFETNGLQSWAVRESKNIFQI
jgi:D-glycero-alpha-D-manno-heptose-7-phosphate kinase